VRIEIRPVDRLRGQDQAATADAVSAVLRAAGESPADLVTLRVVADWIQYRASFREVADLRPVLTGPPADGQAGTELAIDLRRAGAELGGAVAGLLSGQRDEPVPLEPWGPGADSCIWRFNALYWQALADWEQSAGRQYEQALPGGTSDARNTAAARDLVLELFKVWDDLAARGTLPAELYVVELGVGNGGQARTFLDELAALAGAHGRDYYQRLRYVMGDYSPHVLRRATQAVAHHAKRVTGLAVDATQPAASLGFLSGQAFLVFISNVYDNLPTDEVASIGGRPYLVQVRAALPADQAHRIATLCSARATSVPDLIGRLLRLGPEHVCDALPEHFAEPQAAVGFWREVWGALRLQERYLPVDDLGGYRVGPGLTGEILRPQLALGDVRVHVSNGALDSFAGTLPLLHPGGRLVCHDLFVTDPREYLTRFRGPGKYDGSVVNWVNGPLLRGVGRQAGFDVKITPFAQRPSANVRTLTAARAR
jgi:hypothetical protein